MAITRAHPSIKFAIVGAVGFLIDAGILLTLHEGIGIDLSYSRVVAFCVAASSNWVLNRNLTFSGRHLQGSKVAEWSRFIGSAIVSAVPNLGLFFLLLLILPQTTVSILFAFCCGILAGYASNYYLASVWVFRHEDPDTQGLVSRPGQPEGIDGKDLPVPGTIAVQCQGETGYSKR